MLLRADEIPEEVVSSPLPREAKRPSTLVRADDLDAIHDTVSVSTDDLNLAELGLDEKQRNSLAAKGKIGFFEQAIRTSKMEKVPVIGLPALVYEAAAFKRAHTRLQKNDYKDDKDLKAHDTALVDKALEYAGEEQLRGLTLGAKIFEGAAQLPAYMVEFAISKFFADPGATTAARVTSKQLLKLGVKQGVRKVAAGTAKWGTAAAIRTGTVFAPRVAAQAYRNESALNLTPTDKGFKLNDQVQSKPITSFLKAAGDVYIEVFSEEAGKFIFNPLFKKMGSGKFLAGTGKAITNLYKKFHPSDAIGKLFTQSGWDGFVSEMGEEVLGDQMRALFNVQDFGVKGGNTLDRMLAAIPDGDELAVMMGVLAVPGASGLVMQGGYGAMQAYRTKKKEAGIKTGSLASQLKEQQFDPVETALKEAQAPLPQVELTEEELAEITVKQRAGEVKFEEGKPVPERDLVKEITSSKEFKEADREKQMELLIRGRTADLDVQRTTIEKTMTALEKDITKTTDKKVTAAKTKELVKLSKQLMSIHAQLSDVVDSTAEELAREKVLLPGETLETLRGKARDVGGRIARSAVEQVFRNKKAQATERRTALVKYLQARLPGPENAKLREKFMLRAAKDMTEAKLQKMLAEIENLRETVRSKQLRQRAGDIVNKMRSKIVNGVKKGVFANANIQALADEVIRISELSAPAAEAELTALHAQIVALNEAGEGSSEVAQDLKYKAGLMSSIGGLEQRGTDDMETAIRALVKQLAQFQTGRDMVKELRKAQWKVEEAEAVANIENSEWNPNMLLKPLKTVGSVFRTLYQFSSFNLETFWRDLGLDRMVAEPLHKISRSTAALQQHFDRPVRQAMFDIYNVSKTNTRQFMKFLTERMSLKDSDNSDTRPFIRTIVLNNGETKEVKMSRWDVMYWFAVAYQEEGVPDAEAYETLTGENELAAIREQAELESKGGQRSDTEDLIEILDMMSYAEPNQLVDDGEGGKTRLGGGHIASFLAGMRTAQVKAILKNLESGKALKEIQQDMLDELLEGYRSEVIGAEAGAENAPSAEDLVVERQAKIKGNAIPAVSLEDMFADLTDQDRQFAMEMRKIFTSFWEIINPTYARATGVDMTQIASFIPWIRKTASQKTVEEMFTQYAMVEGHVTPFPNSTKERRSTSTAPFAQTSLMDVHMGFRDQMSHWVATHDITVRMQRYLKNDAIRAAINRATGGVQLSSGKWIDSAALRLMDFHLRGIASRGRSDHAIRIPFMNAMRRNLTRYYLVKPKQFLLQVSSAFTAIQQIGFVDFVAGISSFIRDPKGANDLMSKALSMHNRYNNFSMEMKELGLRAQNEKKVKLNFFDKYALTFVKLGNRSGINLGGWAVFRAEFNKTKSLDKAFKAFDSFVLNTQQSAVREQQSAVTVGPARILFQFVSAVGQYGRIYYGSWSNLMKNPSSKSNIKQWARTMIIFHGLIPTARWAISQIGLPAPDDEEQEEQRRNQLLRNMIIGPFNGLWLLGDMASLAAHIITGEEGFDTGPAVISQINKTKNTLAEAIREAIDDESDPDEVLNSLLKAGKETAGLTAGVPGPASDMIRAMFLHAQGEFDPKDTLGVLYGQSIDMINYSRGDY